jgi:hypothetical protein
MILLGLVIFSFCSWAIFSKRFCDGFVAKHFFIFSAITAMLVVMDPINTKAAISSVLLLALGLAYWVYKNRTKIATYLHILSH